MAGLRAGRWVPRVRAGATDGEEMAGKGGDSPQGRERHGQKHGMTQYFLRQTERR